MADAPPPVAADPFRAAVALEAWAHALDLSDLSARHALRAAALLADPRAAEALPRLPEATRRGLAALHRMALPAAAVTDLGGFACAFAWAEANADLLPGEGGALVVGELPPDGEPGEPFRPGSAACLVWRLAEGWCVGRIDMAGPAENRRVTPRPVEAERETWATAWRLMGGRWDRLAVKLMDEGAAEAVARFEAGRQAIIRGDAPVLH